MHNRVIRVSVIMPMDRPGADALRAIAAVVGQKTAATFELLVAAPSGTALPPGAGVRLVAVDDRNPAVRRNAAAREARGEILAFVDDDAFAAPDWIDTAVRYLDAHPGVVALGGPDPAPEDSSPAELFADTLLVTRWVGSGIVAHEAREGVFPVRRPWDVALVNLFVRRSAFEAARGFDETIGYIGEDTDLVNRLPPFGSVVYHDGVVVYHRRRRFPREYLRQRWRYRLKTGERLARGGSTYRTAPVLTFLAAGAAVLALVMFAPGSAASLALLYAIVVTALAIPSTRLPLRWWPFIPFAFALHHGTYFAGIVTGMVKGIVTRGVSRARR